MQRLTNRLAAAVCMCAWAVNAETVYVDRASTSATEDGSEEHPYKTIQAGVAAAAKNDTVLVAPGSYDEGGAATSDEPGYLNRVLITKAIVLESRKGAAVTHIVGRKDAATLDDPEFMGTGADAVRCVRVAVPDGAAVVRGFTLRDGAGQALTYLENIPRANAGAILATGASRAYLVDCVVSNCVGVRGGAMSNASAVRTRFVNNRAIGKGAVGAYCNTLFCAGYGNRGGGALVVGGTHVNGTFAGNLQVGKHFSEAAKVYNTISLLNTGDLVESLTTPTYCFSHSVIVPPADSMRENAMIDETCVEAGRMTQLFAPLLGDLRPLPDSDARDLGAREDLTKISLPGSLEAERYRDLDGREIAADQPLHAGAVQTLSPAPAGGCVWFKGADACTVDGRETYGRDSYFFGEAYPTQHLVAPVFTGTKALFGLETTADTFEKRFFFPKMDDTFWVMPPSAGHVHTNKFLAAETTVHVDRASAAETADGTAERPYKTIQAALDSYADDRSHYHVVRVAEGRYDQDEGLQTLFNLKSRVTVKAPTRLIGAGADKTVIAGAPDPESPAGDGRGANAVRCMAVDSIASVTCVQGIRLADGYCGYIVPDSDHPEHRGAGIVGNGLWTTHLADCVISNCVGSRGVSYGVTMWRTRVTDSVAHGGGVRYTRMISCVMDEMTKGNDLPFGHGCFGRQCTLVGRNNEEEYLNSSTALTNSVLLNMRKSCASFNIAGNVMWNFLTTGDTGNTLYLDPQFTRLAGHDYTPLASSPILEAGVLTDDFADEYCCDFNGEALAFTADGRGVAAGAVHRARPGWSVAACGPLYGVRVEPAAGYGEL